MTEIVFKPGALRAEHKKAIRDILRLDKECRELGNALQLIGDKYNGNLAEARNAYHKLKRSINLHPIAKAARETEV